MPSEWRPIMDYYIILFIYFFGTGVELEAYALSNSSSSFFSVRYFQDRVLWNYLPRSGFAV
jgi:hypothetical protein